jgi:hypothetical protein
VGDDTVDAETGETMFVGHRNARVEERIARAGASDIESSPRHPGQHR